MTGLHGDDLTAALLPTAADLVVAVHDMDRIAVAHALMAAERLAGDALTAARHLAVVTAGMASLDRSVAEQLWWTTGMGDVDNPTKSQVVKQPP